MSDTRDQVTEAQLQAAFMAARAEGKILDDEILRAIIVAARKAPRQPKRAA